MSEKPISRLQEILAKGEFAVTAECGPPRGANPEVIRKKGEVLNGYVDAVNVTDNQTAIVTNVQHCGVCASLTDGSGTGDANGRPGSKQNRFAVGHHGCLFFGYSKIFYAFLEIIRVLAVSRMP